jgi:hypothetical protein
MQGIAGVRRKQDIRGGEEESEQWNEWVEVSRSI